MLDIPYWHFLEELWMLILDAVKGGSDITLGLSSMSVLGNVFLGVPEPCFLCFTSPAASVAEGLLVFKLLVLIPAYLHICVLESVAGLITMCFLMFLLCCWGNSDPNTCMLFSTIHICHLIYFIQMGIDYFPCTVSYNLCITQYKNNNK